MSRLGVVRAHRQLLAFLIVGLASAAIDAGVFLLLNRLGVPPAPASAASFCAAFAVNYRGNRDLVFSAGRIPGALRRYVMLVIGNLGVSAGGVAGLVVIGAPPVVAKLSTMVLVAAINFLLLRRWVFATRSPDRARSFPGHSARQAPDQPGEQAAAPSAVPPPGEAAVAQLPDHRVSPVAEPPSTRDWT